MIDGHKIFKILVQYLIDSLSLAIDLQVKSHIKLKFGPNLLHKKCAKFQHKLGISITYNDFGHAICLTHMLKNSVIISIVVTVVLIVPNLANFKNLSTITKIISFSSHKGKHVIKSIDILSNGPFKISKGFI
jgi:hypothetical protein